MGNQFDGYSSGSRFMPAFALRNRGHQLVTFFALNSRLNCGTLSH
jgi:hypothetical protein